MRGVYDAMGARPLVVYQMPRYWVWISGGLDDEAKFHKPFLNFLLELRNATGIWNIVWW